MRSHCRTAGVIVSAIVMGAGVLGASPSGAAVVVNDAPASIASDCSHDVTAELMAWIASVPDTSTLNFAADGCYRVDGTIVVSQRNGLTFEGNNATFRQVTDGSEIVNPKFVRTRNVWTFGRSTNLVVRNLTTFGANPYAGRGERAYKPKFEAQHAYLIQGVKGMLMDHVAAYDTYDDFVFVGPGTENLTVQNSTFARNGRQGWTINGTNIVFQHNSITDTRRATIDMEPSAPSWVSKNIYIRDNDVGPGRLYFFASVGAAAPMDNINIIGNRLHKKAFQVFVSAPKGMRTNYHIVDNVSDGVTSGFGSSMVLWHISGLEVRNNTIPLQPSHPLAAVGLRGSEHVRVTDNVFRGGHMVIRDRGANTDVTQSSNQIGMPPMRVPPPTDVAGPTPKA
ncbi:MAG: right-handed parallel beta-helix repeat-containing protein [Acidimicrobiia bacterium]